MAKFGDLEISRPVLRATEEKSSWFFSRWPEERKSAKIWRSGVATQTAVRHDGAKRRWLCKTNSEQPCCTRDEGGPLGPGLQDRGSNHRKLLRHHGWGGERCGKGGLNPSGVCW